MPSLFPPPVKSPSPGTATRSVLGLALCAVALSVSLRAETLYVDHEAGNDGKSGKTPQDAWKHAPGDSQAEGNPAAHTLGAGDVIRFKGGVVYRGSVSVKTSSEKGKPIVFDGNTAGDWGEGRAVIDGGEPVTGWKRCASAAEAGGNPRWAEIFYTDVPRPKSYTTLNLSSPDASLPIAQHPNPQDFFWQEDKTNFLTAKTVLEARGAPRVTPGKGTRENRDRSLNNLILGSGRSRLAVVDPLPGGSFDITMDGPREIVAVGIAQQPKYAAVREIAFLGDGKELLRAEMARGEDKIQRFDLPAPATLTTLTVKLLSAHEGEKGGFTVLNQVAAYDRDGANLFKSPETMTLTDPDNLGRKEADWYDGMTFAFHGGNNHIIYLPVKGFDPATGTLAVATTAQRQYNETRYCLFNSVRLIDQPGEYSVEDTADPKRSRVYLLPREVRDGQPSDVTIAKESSGFALEGASHVTVRGFLIRRQNGSAFSARDGGDILLDDCEMTLVRGTVVSTSRIDGITVERCHIHDNPGHSKGIVLHTCDKAVVRDCRLVRNTSTAVDYYACSNGHVVGNTILENKGSHANGLTFYVGNKNILVERNHVARGNLALTLQEGENLTFRNNFFDANGESTVVGIWPALPLKNVRFLHNTIVRSNPGKEYMTGLFSNSRRVEGLEVRNNIIDGLFSDHGIFKDGTFSNNLYTRIGRDQAQGLLGKDERVETDLKKIFVDPDSGDFRLRDGSPALGAGTDAGVGENLEGKPRPAGRVDLGAY